MIEDCSPKNQQGSTSINDIFTPDFMEKYTQFNSITEMLASGGFEINSEEDYEAIPDQAIDTFVAKTTKFNSWKEMLLNAVETYGLQG